MQKKKKSYSLSQNLKENSFMKNILASNEMVASEESSSLFTDKTCYDITYKEFIDFIFNKDKTEKDKVEASRLSAEFSELCGDLRQQTFFNLYKKVVLVNAKIETLDICRVAVTYAVTEPIIKYLAKNNIRITEQTLTIDIIKKIDAKLQQLALKQKEASTEYDICVKNSKTNKESDRGDYYAILANISQSVRFSVPETTIAAIVAEYIKQLNKKNIVNEHRRGNKTNS